MTAPARREIGHLIERPRIAQILLGRFEHTVTMVIAPAGSGKTSSINQAIGNNQLDPRGRDILVPLTRASDDPERFLRQIGMAAGVAADGDLALEDIRERITDRLWAEAPEDVALVLDDAHLITDPDCALQLQQLLEDLPRNAHLVLVTRTPIDLRLARLRATGQLLEIESTTLDFDDDELDHLRAARQAPTSIELPRHAATADLQLAAGSNASTDFLREEVLAALGVDRLAHLRRMSVFDDFDDDLVVSMTDGQFSADTLLDALPLVESTGTGNYRLHPLLREALLAQQPEGEHRKAASVGADLLLDRGLYAASIRLHLLAGDEIAAREVARHFVLGPVMHQSIGDISEIWRLVSSFDPDSALRLLLEASLHFAGAEHKIADRFDLVAEAARAEGDELLEVVALHRSLQAHFLDIDMYGDHLRHLDRLGELSATVPFALGAIAHARSQLAQYEGDSVTALANLDAYHHLGDMGGLVIRNQRLCDLGRVEEVGVGLTPDDLTRLPPGSEVFIAFGMWLRGEASPEVANAFVGPMLTEMTNRGLDHPLISTLGAATAIALAAGDTIEARRRADQATDLVSRDAPRTIALFAAVAAASVAADATSDEAAAAILDPEVTGLPIDPWPLRAHLLALPLIYIVRPEARDVLDRIELGPALACAVSAGRALVALRDRDDPAPAAALPWSLLDLLRVHVLPHHLVELACAATMPSTRAASPGAEQALGSLPDLDRHLVRVATERRSIAAGRATELLGRRPRTAPHTLRLDLLGDTRLWRDGTAVLDDDWVKRPRVRELLALLIDRGRMERGELIDTLWPDHDDDVKADGNFRAHLSKLQQVLEPGRPRTVDPYFLRQDGEVLVLHPDVRTDVDDFEDAVEIARRHDAAGAPARALEGYVDAIDLYRGEYLLGIDAGWAVLQRVRLRALAAGTTCRIGELTAARGQPEDAARWAEQARRIDPFSERAARIFVASLVAAGEHSAAKAASDEFISMFAAAGITLEPSTVRVFNRSR